MNSSEPSIWLHHLGCLARNMEELIQGYGPLLDLRNLSAPVKISSQKVEVAFLPMTSGVFLELVRPDTDNGVLNRMLERGVTFYHLGFMCRNLHASEEELLRQGGRVITRFASEAFEGRECVFVLNRNVQMIELIQAPDTVAAAPGSAGFR